MTTPRRLQSVCLAAATALLSACGTTAPTMDGTDPYAGADYPWSYSAAAAGLGAQSLTPGDNSLSYERVLDASNGWGPLEVNRSNGEMGASDGRPLTLDGQVYARGFGVHAGSAMRIGLQGAGASCSRFRVGMGVDDEVGARGSVVFQIYLDGVRAFDSGRMTGAGRTRWANLDITGKQELRLVVTDAGNGKNYDHADWVRPVVSCAAVGAQPAVSLSQSRLEIFHKHSAAVEASFVGISGPVDLRLDVAEGSSSGLQLRTTSLSLPAGASTQSVVIDAPGLPEFYTESQSLVAPYTLVVSQGGRDIASAPITVQERLLSLQASVTPAEVSARPGETVRFTVAVEVTPALDQILPLGISNCPNQGCAYRATPVSDTYGDGGLLKRDFQVTFPGGDMPTVDLNLNYFVDVGDFAGYRMGWYGSTEATLSWRPLR